MDDLQRKNNDTSNDDRTPVDPVRDDAEFQVEEAQDVITEAKEDAKRDWGGAYSDTDDRAADAPEVLEGDARHAKSDLDGTIDDTQLNSGGYQTETAARADNMAADLQARAEDLGHHAEGAGMDVEDQARDARAQTGRAFDDVRRDFQEGEVNPSDPGLTEDERPDEDKGFIDKLKDVFTGDDRNS